MGYYGYYFEVILRDTMIWNYFAGEYFSQPFEIIVAANDSAKFIIYSPDLCPICKRAIVRYFEDTLLVFNNSINLGTLRIFMSGEGFPSAVGEENGYPAVIEPVLNANYPNPFNNSTTISYRLPRRVHVRLVIFNTLGKEIAVLADGIQTEGLHTVEFAPGHLSSAIYFYRLEAGGFRQIRRFNIIK